MNEILKENKYTPIPYNIYGVKLWAVESEGGHISAYCNTKEDAEQYCKEINDEH